MAKTKAKKPASKTETLSVEIEKRQSRAKEIARRLHKLYSDADCALHHKSAFELLVSTILSAQCTDDRVNMVTPDLFKRYPTVEAFAEADQSDIETLIKSTGFFRNKAKNILGAARTLAENFGGDVPDNMEDLLTLPGVARKTANVILGTWFKKNDGVVVDTHIGRLAHRLDLSWRSRDSKDAVKIEQDLMAVFPKKEWTFIGHALIWHGRRVCPARNPDCDACTLSDVCPSSVTDGHVSQTAKKKAKARRKPTAKTAGKKASRRPTASTTVPRKKK